MQVRSLTGRVALVTGASRGIGRAIALELARAGARVALNYRSGEVEARAVAGEIAAIWAEGAASRRGRLSALRAAEELAAEGNWEVAPEEPASGKDATLGGTVPAGQSIAAEDVTMLVQADVSVSEEARAMVGKVIAEWGRLDILVNNAGITRDRTLRKLSDQDWQAVINTNLNSIFYCTSAAVPTMIEQQYGRIVSISSVIGQSGNVGQTNYAAAKAGIVAFTKSAALELARYNITVNAVAPGFTRTEMVEKVPENIQEQLKGKIPLGRFAEPEEIARAVRFLVAEGDYITGQQLNVNGGLYM